MNVCGRVYIDSGRGRNLKFYNMADIHAGASACHEKMLKADVASIAEDENAFVLMPGDLIDAISHSDQKRFDGAALAEWIKPEDLGHLAEVQYDWLEKTLQPIKHKIIAAGMGNHTLAYAKHNNNSMMHPSFCHRMGIIDMGYAGMLDIVIRQTGGAPALYRRERPKGPEPTCKTFRFCCHHGTGAATTPGGKLNMLTKLMTYFDADVYFTGHVHERQGMRVARIGADRGCQHLVEKVTVGCISGSYHRCYLENAKVPSYGEPKLYRPTVLGAKYITINTTTWDMEVVI